MYGIFAPDDGEVIGGSGLHKRVGDGALEIGYWIRASRVRQGYATEACAALTRAAFAVCGVERVEIHVDLANAPSLAVPRRLGFVEEATLRGRLPGSSAAAPRRDKVVFSLFVDGLGRLPAPEARLEAYDCAGVRVL